MSRERLEELLELHEKAVVAYEDCDFLEMRGYLETLFLEGFTDYLIEQAERAHELKEENISLKAIKAGNEELIKMLEQQNKRYKEALEFYADEENYELDISYNPAQAIDCMILDDSGHQARKALGVEQ